MLAELSLSTPYQYGLSCSYWADATPCISDKWAFQGLTRLTKLHVDGGAWAGSLPPPQALLQMKALRSLSICFAQHHGCCQEGADGMLRALAALGALRELRLVDANTYSLQRGDTGHARQLPMRPEWHGGPNAQQPLHLWQPELFMIAGLERLIVQQFTELAFQELPQGTCMPALTSLTLAAASAGVQRAHRRRMQWQRHHARERWPASLCGAALPALQRLKLRNCTLGIVLPPEFTTLCTLRTLVLEGCRLRRVPSPVRSLPSLAELHLGGNAIPRERLVGLPVTPTLTLT